MKNSLIKLKNEINKSKNQKWLHTPSTLTDGHIVYLVKFLGGCEASRPKGMDVVQEAVQKLRFSDHIKKSEGSKMTKVELTISVDGVTIQKPKSKDIMHQYPLHKISFCADDKAEKKFFSFIGLGEDGIHKCFVFISDKLSEEITLTIGQAFDLSYKKYLNIAAKTREKAQETNIMKQKLDDSEKKNALLVEMLRKALNCKNMQQLEDISRECQSSSLLEDDQVSVKSDKTNSLERGITTPIIHGPPVPPRNQISRNDDIIEDLIPRPDSINEDEDSDFDPRADEKSEKSDGIISSPFGDDDDFDPRADEKSRHSSSNAPTLLPPPPSKNQKINDPFEISPSPLMDDSKIVMGFNSTTFATVDFSLDDLDPLKN